MNVESLGVLVGLLGLFPLVLVFLYEYRHTRSSLRLLGRNWSDAQVKRLIFGKWLFGMLCFCGFFVSCILAMSGWEWGEEASQRDRSSLELVVVVDSSRSMLAPDLLPRRLDRGLALAQEVLAALPDSRVAMVSFAGAARKLLPMTEDRLALDGACKRLLANPGQSDLPAVPASGTGGSNFAQALDLALSSFQAISQRNQALLVVSDGEFGSGSLSGPLGLARKRGIPLAIIGTGTLEGSRIPLGSGAWMQDMFGNDVISRQRVEVLKDMAKGSRGWYVNAGDNQAAGAIAAGLREFVERSAREGFILVPVNRDNVFVVFALGFLVAYLAVRAIRWRSVW